MQAEGIRPLRLQSSRAEFERCWPWLEPTLRVGAYEHDGIVYVTHKKEDVWQQIVYGQTAFWSTQNSVVLSNITRHPTGLKTQWTWCCGGKKGAALKELRELVKVVEEWGRRNGC